MRILFIRHGRTEVNAESRVHSRGDVAALDELGVEQAHKLAIACSHEGVKKLYCSPEKRARETAEIIGNELGLTPVVLKNLRERDWGDWSGKTWTEIEARLELMNLGQRYEFAPPNGESWKAMDGRLEQALKLITYDGHDVTAVVTHGGALRALMPIIKHEPKQTSFKYDFANASITSFDFDGARWKLIHEGDITHLNA